MQADILNLERNILSLKREKKVWLEYKAAGSALRARQIDLLEKELKDMNESFSEMSGTECSQGVGALGGRGERGLESYTPGTECVSTVA